MLYRYSIITLTLVVVYLAWTFIPGTNLDRQFFDRLGSLFHESPYCVSGEGRHGHHYRLRKFELQKIEADSEPLTEITITKDEEGIFQSSPPSPLDFAVILKNLRRMGRSSIAIGVPLAWQDIDMISQAALEQQLSEFELSITSAPLSRGPRPSALPSAFRRASIDISKVVGDINLLPIVNYVSMPNTLLGNDSSWAGFLSLESEYESTLDRLIARWDDRLVLSFPLLTAIHHFKVKPEDIEVRLGHWISFSKNGPYIPIDEYGRLVNKMGNRVISRIPATKLIDAPDNFLSPNDSEITLVDIDNLTMERDKSAIHKGNAANNSAIVSSASSSFWHTTEYARLPWFVEILLIFSLFCLIYGLALLLGSRFWLSQLILIYIIVYAHLTVFEMAQIWLPYHALIAACLVSLFLGCGMKKRKIKQLPSQSVRECVDELINK